MIKLESKITVLEARICYGTFPVADELGCHEKHEEGRHASVQELREASSYQKETSCNNNNINPNTNNIIININYNNYYYHYFQDMIVILDGVQGCAERSEAVRKCVCRSATQSIKGAIMQ